MVGILRKKEVIMEDYTIYPVSYQLLDLSFREEFFIDHLKFFIKLCRFSLILEFCEINEMPISVILKIKDKGSDVKNNRLLSCNVSFRVNHNGKE